MKINFGDYTYFGDRNNTYTKQSQYAFDEGLFNNLVANRQYTDAANYAEQYHFNDPKAQRQFENNIRELRRNGRIAEAVYSRINNSEKLAHVEFAENVFNSNGIDNLLEYTQNDATKSYVEKFKEAKKLLGSRTKYNPISASANFLKSIPSVSHYYLSKGLRNVFNNLNQDLDDDDEATSLSVTFEPKKQTLLGIDWLAADNDNNIDTFYEQTGLTQKALENAGVQITNKDGKTTLHFGKDNPLANSILAGIPNRTGFEKTLTDIRHAVGYAAAKYLDGYRDVYITGYNRKGETLETVTSLDSIQDIINAAIHDRNEVFTELDANKKQYSSIIGPSITDDLDILNVRYERGEISSEEYHKQYKQIAGWIDDEIAGMGSGNKIIYSNAFNDEDNDETLRELDNEDRSRIMNLINAVNKNRVHYLAADVDGEIGTMIVIDPEKGDDDGTIKSAYKGRRRHIFIPGLFQKQAQERINSDTSLSAIKEYNNMKSWGYDYKTVDGRVIDVDPNGNAWIDKKEVSKDDAIREIHKDIIKDRANKELKYNYLNTNDEITDFTAYEKLARAMSIRAGNELHPEIPLIKKDRTPYTIEDIFSYKAMPDDDELLGEKAVDELQYQMYDKLKDIFDVYNYILKGTSYYKE